MYSKRGMQIVSIYLIGLILLVVGLGIALGFIFGVFSGSSNIQNQQICHLSVLTRATAPDALQSNVPLKCTTDKVCFTSSLFNGKCSQFAGEEGVSNVRLPSDSGDAAQLIMKTIAEAEKDCWSMMGQGKLDLYARASDAYVGSSGSPTCVVCTRIALSSDVKENEKFYNELGEKINMQRYLSETQIEGESITYLKFLSGGSISSFGGADLIAYNKISEVTKEDINKGAPSSISRDSDDQIAIIFSQVKPTDVGEVLSNIGYAAAGGAGASAAFSLPLTLGAAKILYLGPQAIVTVPLTAITVGAIALNAYDGKQAAAGYCGKFETSLEDENKQSGCSLMQPVNYNVKALNAFCPGKIQGNP